MNIHISVSARSLLLAMLVCLGCHQASAQLSDSQGIARDAMAVAPVETASGLEASLDNSESRTSLQRVIEAFESRLNASLAETRKFTVVSRRNLDAILQEQSLAGSGFINTKDPQTAQMLKVAGVKWLAVPRVIGFENVVRTREFEGLDRLASRRTVRFTIVVDVLETTTGVVGATAQVIATNSNLADENINALPEGSDPTNSVLDSVAQIAATDVACQVLGLAYPAKMISSGTGMVNFNRGQGGCVSKGEMWRVFRPGELMVDPDTGEKLGRNETEVGALSVTEILPAYSRGRMIAGAAEAGDILRKAPKSWQPPKEYASAPSQNTTSASNSSGNSVQNVVIPKVAPGFSMAVIVQVVPNLPSSQAIPEAAAQILESMVIARTAALGVRVISPQDVLQALRPGAAEEMISSDAAVTRLAKSLGADSALVVTLTGKSANRSTLTRNGSTTTVINHQINGNWRLVNSGSGEAVSGASFSDHVALMDSNDANQAITVNTGLLNELLDDSADFIADSVGKAVASGLIIDSNSGLGWIRVNASIDGITVPEIVKQGDGWRVVSGTLPVVFEADVSIDGLVVGTTPLSLPVSVGPHRLTISRVGSDTWSKEIQVTGALQTEPQSLRVSLRMTDQERARWLENATIFQELKIGSILTDAQVNVMEGFATYLSQSGFRIDRRTTDEVKVDTNEAPIIDRSTSFWNRPW